MQPLCLLGPEFGMQVGRVDAVTPDRGTELPKPCFNQTARPVSRGWSARAREARTADRCFIRISKL